MEAEKVGGKQKQPACQDMTLRDYLCIPYLVEAELVEHNSGAWVRRATHPELPDCSAESPRIERTLDLLDRRRVEVIVDLLRGGILPPVPRPKLPDAGTENLLRRSGLHDALAPLLDLPAIALAERQGENEDAVARG
jgi:hypothetical protein